VSKNNNKKAKHSKISNWASLAGCNLSPRRQNNQLSNSHHNDTQENDLIITIIRIRYNNIQHTESHLNNTKHRDIQHKKTQNSDIQHMYRHSILNTRYNATQQIETQHYYSAFNKMTTEQH
jgi:hypothetical protein